MKTCTIPECDNPHRARGLCAQHWNATYRKDPHREVPCAVCGTMVVKNGPGVKRRSICSERCRYHLIFGHDIAEHRELVGPVPRRPTVVQDDTPHPPKARFVSATCSWCGSPYVYDQRQASGSYWLYCSRKCSRKRAKVERRARERNATGSYTWSEVIHIYLTIGGCAYCWQPSTDIEPDHVIPLCRSGSNSITNVVPACRACNGDKGSMLLYEWAESRTARGLQPRTLHPSITHITEALLLTA